MGKWRRHSQEFKQQAVERMKGCDNIHELASELGVERKLLYTWKWQFEGRPEKNHADYSGGNRVETVEDRLRRENRELKEALGQKAAELDFFVAALRRVNWDRQSNACNGDPASIAKSVRRRNRKAD
jgi:transposase-like protein